MKSQFLESPDNPFIVYTKLAPICILDNVVHVGIAAGDSFLGATGFFKYNFILKCTVCYQHIDEPIESYTGLTPLVKSKCVHVFILINVRI